MEEMHSILTCCGGCADPPPASDDADKNRAMYAQVVAGKILREQLFASRYVDVDSPSSAGGSVVAPPARSASARAAPIEQLEGLGTWAFDPLAASVVAATSVTPAVFAGVFAYAMEASGLTAALRLSRSSLRRFAIDVAQIYHDSYNPYHNMRHALHVFHSMHMLCMMPEIKAGIVDAHPEVAFAAYVAAFCHDIDHCGSTNRFLVATNNQKAIRYHDVSPQEKHHAFVATQLLEASGLLDTTSISDPDVICDDVVRIIVATNIAYHDTVLAAFYTDCPTRCMKLLLKCADLSHTFAPLSSHLRWVEMLQAEFFIQGDREKFHGLPVTAMFDRNSPCTMHSTQSSFFQMIAMPMFEKLFEAFPSSAEHIKPMLDRNRAHWQSMKYVKQLGALGERGSAPIAAHTDERDMCQRTHSH